MLVLCYHICLSFVSASFCYRKKEKWNAWHSLGNSDREFCSNNEMNGYLGIFAVHIVWSIFVCLKLFSPNETQLIWMCMFFGATSMTAKKSDCIRWRQRFGYFLIRVHVESLLICFVIKLPACGQKIGMKTFLWRKNKWIAWNERQKWEIDEITSRVKWRYLHVWTLERNKFSLFEMLLDCCLPQFNYISFFWCNFIAIRKFYGILEFLIDVNIKLADRTMLKAPQILAFSI